MYINQSARQGFATVIFFNRILMPKACVEPLLGALHTYVRVYGSFFLKILIPGPYPQGPTLYQGNVGGKRFMVTHRMQTKALERSDEAKPSRGVTVSRDAH